MKTVRIDTIGKVVTGNTPPKKVKEYYAKDYTWIKPTDIQISRRYVLQTEECYSKKAYIKYKSSLLPPLSTCVVTIGTVGEKICLTREYCFTNQSINAIIPDINNFDPMFVFYLMKYNLPLVAHRNPGTASGRHHVSKSNFSSINIKVFNLLKQRIVGRILSNYDDLIENNEYRIRILEKMSQLIYDEWFINFRFPGHENEEIVKKHYGRIPKGWMWDKLGNVLELAYGKGLKENDRVPGKFPVYGSSGIIGFHEAYIVVGPTIIVGRKGNVGSVYWTYDNCYPIDTAFYVKTNLSLYYVYFNFQHQNFINSDAAVPGLSRRQAYDLPFLIPEENILTNFENYIEPIFKQIWILKKQTDKLEQIRDLLLEKMMSDEIKLNRLDMDLKSD